MRALLLGVMCCLVPAGASAQVSAGAIAGLSLQRDGQSDQPYLGPPFGGQSAAFVGMLDANITPRITIGGEISTAGRISGEQSQRAPGGSNTFTSRHRDDVFSGTVKMLMGAASLRTAVVAAAGIARRDTIRAGEFVPFDPRFPRTPIAETLSHVVFAVGGGVDLAGSIGEHVGILASARLHQLLDEDHLSSGVVRRGVSSTIVRAGAGVQLRF